MHLHSIHIVFTLFAVMLLAPAFFMVVMAWKFLKAHSAYEALIHLKTLVFWGVIFQAYLSTVISLSRFISAADRPLHDFATSPEDRMSLLITYEMISLGLVVSIVFLSALWVGLTIVLKRIDKSANDATIQLQPAERS